MFIFAIKTLYSIMLYENYYKDLNSEDEFSWNSSYIELIG